LVKPGGIPELVKPTGKLQHKPRIPGLIEVSPRHARANRLARPEDRTEWPWPIN
jgi:hypothetical protein